MKNKISCSVSVLTFNSGKNLKKVLDSVKDFSEIIICDGGSTDNTTDVANQYGCKIIFQDKKFKNEDNTISDFGGIRNQSLDASSFDWFLFVDSDEYLGDEIVNEIRSIVEQKTSPAAYWVPRKYVLKDNVIDYASTYPSQQMRFFHKDAVNKFVKKIHERIEVKSGGQVRTLNNFMFVPVLGTDKEMYKKMDYYAQLEVDRKGDVTLFDFLKICFKNLKISVLYIYRFIRNHFFYSGKHMPFRDELRVHVYNFKVCVKFLKKIKFITKK